LLKAGVDFASISHWLGHASLDTTMRYANYARADVDMKRQALMQVFPDVLGNETPTDRHTFDRLPVVEDEAPLISYVEFARRRIPSTR
jgi:integrase/recombinase XerD